MKKLKIAPGKREDLDAIAQVYDALNDHLAATINYPGWRKGVYPTGQDAAEGIRGNALFVAKMGTDVVGSIILNHKPEKGYDSAHWLVDAVYDDIFVIHTLVVHPQYLRRGIGQLLLDFAWHHAGEQQMRSIRLDVYEKNAPAIGLYERNGYHYIDTVDLGLGQYGLDRFRLYERLV